MHTLRAVRRLPAVLAAVLLAVCGAPYASKEPVSQLMHIGPFTVRAANLPAAVVVQAFPREGPYALTGSDWSLNAAYNETRY